MVTLPDLARHLVLPVAASALSQSSWLVLFVREPVIGVLRGLRPRGAGQGPALQDRSGPARAALSAVAVHHDHGGAGAGAGAAVRPAGPAARGFALGRITALKRRRMPHPLFQPGDPSWGGAYLQMRVPANGYLFKGRADRTWSR
nr:hypothetical protein GCM10020093_032780 [Planobispora longispora]